MKNDEKIQWAQYVSATPLKTCGIVVEKYVFAFAINALMCVYCRVLAYLLKQIYDLAVPNCFFGFFVFFLFQMAIEFPIVYLFGSKYAKKIKIAFVLLLIFCLIIYILYGKLPESFNWDRFLDEIITTVVQGRGRILLKKIVTIFAGVSFVTYVVSFFISNKVYKVDNFVKYQ